MSAESDGEATDERCVGKAEYFHPTYPDLGGGAKFYNQPVATTPALPDPTTTANARRPSAPERKDVWDFTAKEFFGNHARAFPSLESTDAYAA